MTWQAISISATALPESIDWYLLRPYVMVGSILSATDPVAVVALLKQVGASKRLGTIIEGEALLNDGTAYVMFLVFFERVKTTGEGGDNPAGLAAVAPAKYCPPRHRPPTRVSNPRFLS